MPGTEAASIPLLRGAPIRLTSIPSTYGVTGNGVLIAVLDRGIDWQNNDFRNPDGTTRIEYIFDLTDDTGASDPGNTYGQGTIYTKLQINQALQGGPALATRDAVGHGSTSRSRKTKADRSLRAGSHSPSSAKTERSIFRG